MNKQEKINAVMASLDNAIEELKTIKEDTDHPLNIILLEVSILNIKNAITKLDETNY